jgi:hypothetical protein
MSVVEQPKGLLAKQKRKFLEKARDGLRETLEPGESVERSIAAQPGTSLWWTLLVGYALILLFGQSRALVLTNRRVIALRLSKTNKPKGVDYAEPFESVRVDKLTRGPLTTRVILGSRNSDETIKLRVGLGWRDDLNAVLAAVGHSH